MTCKTYSTTATSSAAIDVRLTLTYVVPRHIHSMADILRVFRGASWVQHIISHVVPYLKASNPAKQEVLQALKPHESTGDDDCVICMSPLQDSVELACGHCFHRTCITLWLNRRSTCPTCRCQFENEFQGQYAFQAIETHVELGQTHLQVVPGQSLSTAVLVTLAPLDPTKKAPKYPCEIKAAAHRKPAQLSPTESRSIRLC
ncbi:unnamed protein product [Aphanomyces euteiches]|uniref:RING-type domain-containing protein n=1 Tax=Aphanomyces euteiches TaxID=100861 RepID=A0A6G0WV28_9STRA|nr:hypothetical protein Ae201684_011392 [Aphanomyces euteiches]KAH9100497.1 hypothetical protein Ae201684P_006694 [Aphanomyces euteiches]KAH9134252.1 hypothetical protein AeRB84_019918 [Aphanomyces euteiches]